MTMNKTIEINVNGEAYNTGFEAAKQGQPYHANPYCRGTIDAANWLAGWTAAAPHGGLMQYSNVSYIRPVTSRYGWLLRYSDASYIRPATASELRDSVCAGGEGVIEVTIDGRAVACYVEE